MRVASAAGGGGGGGQLRGGVARREKVRRTHEGGANEAGQSPYHL